VKLEKLPMVLDQSYLKLITLLQSKYDTMYMIMTKYWLMWIWKMPNVLDIITTSTYITFIVAKHSTMYMIMTDYWQINQILLIKQLGWASPGVPSGCG
jgi:hypothetical protein